MDIEILPPPEDKRPRDIYRVVVTTLDNDEEDKHNEYMHFNFKPQGFDEDLRQCIIDMEIFKKQYQTSGIEAGDNYSHLDIWDKYKDIWPIISDDHVWNIRKEGEPEMFGNNN